MKKLISKSNSFSSGKKLTKAQMKNVIGGTAEEGGDCVTHFTCTCDNSSVSFSLLTSCDIETISSRLPAATESACGLGSTSTCYQF